jgi:hypothetical protein
MHEAVRFHDKSEGTDWMQKTVEFDPSKKSPEHRQYLILIKYLDPVSTGFDNEFIIVEGRTNAYYAIKERIEEIDLKESTVTLEGNRALVDFISVLQFMRHIVDDELVEDDTQTIVTDIIDEFEGEE